MTDESRSLSRRARREQELRAAARPADDTDAFPGAPISESIPTHAPDGRQLTRRERRRLERAQLPMETWTAEEEMIATGQIPAMTPERIAEQERIAREKAEAAQREAQTASSELGVLPPEAASAPPAGAETDQEDHTGTSAPAHGSEAATPARPAVDSVASAPEPTVPQRTSLIPSSSDSAEPAAVESPVAESSPPAPTTPEAAPAQSASPVAPEPAAPVPSAQPDVTSQVDEAPHADDVPQLVENPQRDGAKQFDDSRPVDDGAAAAFGEQPQADHQWWEGSDLHDDREQHDHAPSADHSPSADHAQSPAPAAPRQDPPPAAVPGMPAGMSPEMFAALFPPGSLQRRLMEQQAADQAGPEPEAPEVEDPAAEIRRLTQQAVAGIDAASSRRVAPVDDVDDAAAESVARAVLPNAWGPAAEAVSAPAGAPPAGMGRRRDDPGFDQTPVSIDERPVSIDQTPVSIDERPVSIDEPPVSIDERPVSIDERPVSIDEAPFDAILGDHPGTSALDQASSETVESHRPAFHTVASPSSEGPAVRVPDASEQLTPHHAAFDVPQGPEGATGQSSALWDTHPLMGVDRAAPELPEVRPAQNIPQPDLSSVRRPAFMPQSDDLSSIEPVPTGQIEVPPRERPDLEEAGGPRHFKWAHLAVFGAVAFLLGVVVWNVAMKP